MHAHIYISRHVCECMHIHTHTSFIFPNLQVMEVRSTCSLHYTSLLLCPCHFLVPPSTQSPILWYILTIFLPLLSMTAPLVQHYDVYNIMHKYSLISTWQKIEMYKLNSIINIPSLFSQVSYPKCNFSFSFRSLNVMTMEYQKEYNIYSQETWV